MSDEDRRSRGEGNIRQRPDGTWEARYYSSDGKRRSVYGATRFKVATKLRKEQGDKEQGVAPATGRVTVGRFLERWLVAKKSAVRPSTFAHYESFIRNHVIPGIGATQLRRLTATDVEAFLASKTDLAPRSQHHLRAILRNALSSAERDDLVTKNAARLSAPPKVERVEIDVFNATEARRFMELIQGRDDAAMYMLGMLGLRLGEVLGLRWHDVDYVAGRVTIGQTYQLVQRQRVFGPPKSQSSRRTVTIPAFVAEALGETQKRQAQRRDKAMDAWESHGGGHLCFTDAIGRPRNPSTVTRTLKELLTDAGLPPLTFHGLRHSAATLLMASGTSPKIVADLLGHSDISLTLRTYSHVSEGLRKEATDRLAGLYAAPLQYPQNTPISAEQG